MKNDKDRHDEPTAKRNSEKEIEAAAELFEKLTPNAQKAIIDLIKSLLSAK